MAQDDGKSTSWLYLAEARALRPGEPLEIFEKRVRETIANGELPWAAANPNWKPPLYIVENPSVWLAAIFNVPNSVVRLRNGPRVVESKPPNPYALATRPQPQRFDYRLLRWVNWDTCDQGTFSEFVFQIDANKYRALIGLAPPPQDDPELTRTERCIKDYADKLFGGIAGTDGMSVPRIKQLIDDAMKAAPDNRNRPSIPSIQKFRKKFFRSDRTD
jgi:hypothetical protein